MKPADPDELDKPWRLWASVIIISVLAFSVVFGFLILPVVQGRAAGLDAFTAICRAVGILPGSPAVRQPTSRRRRSPRPRSPGARACCATCRAGRAARGRPGLRRLPWRARHRSRSAEPESRRPVGRGDLQAAARLQERQPHARDHDRHRASPRRAADRRRGGPFRGREAAPLDPTTAEVRDQDIVRLVERGDPARGLPACNSCHGGNAGGPIETPTLSHQNREYLARQLQAFRDGSGATTSTRACAASPQS